MGYVIEIPNYFEPFESTKHEVEKPISILLWLSTRRTVAIEAHYGICENWEAWDYPVLVQINGEAVLQADYGKTIIGEKDIVTMTVLVGDPVTIIVSLLISVAITVAAYLLAPQPPSIGETPEADPTFSLKGQSNANKRGQPIESFFGRCKNWPSYAARPYSRYIDNKQYQYSLFCLGHGTYSVEEQRIGDTPIENFQDVTTEIYLPNETVTLFRNSVVTSEEVINRELYGTNEEEFPLSGIAGPFIINDTRTRIDRIEVDLTFPRGLYYSNDEGGLDQLLASWRLEYQEIDDDGGAIGAWQILTESSKNLATVTPQRFTFSLDVPLGRYHVRAQRTNNKNEDSRAGNTLHWEALRGFLPNVDNFGDVTIIAMRALGTNNLNDQSRALFNLRQTRLLPVYDIETQTWGPLQPTRNPVDATFEALRAQYGGRLEDAKFHFPILLALRQELKDNGDQFDFGFEQATNVWDAARLCLSVARSVVSLSGSKIIAIRDKAETIPTMVFTPEVMIKGSFKWSASFRKPNDADGLEITFIDEDTWKERTLYCPIGDDPSEPNNPSTEKLTGIVNPDKAYREGLYLRAKQREQNQKISFTTGLEGLLPSVNSLVGIVHDVPRWGFSGFLVSRNGNVFLLDDSVEMESGKNYVIGFKRRDGTFAGPYSVEFVKGESDRVTVSEEIPSFESWTRQTNEEPVIWNFGEEGQLQHARLVSVRPASNDRVNLSFVNDSPLIYTFDDETAPVLEIDTQPAQELPVVSGLNVSNVPNTTDQVIASWTPSNEATSYLVEISYDGGEEFSVAGVTSSTSLQFSVSVGAVEVRVAGINTGQGPFDTWSGQVGVLSDPPFPVTGLAALSSFVGNAARIGWNPSNLATSYVVRVMRPPIAPETEDVLLSETEITGTSFSYANDQALTDFGSYQSIGRVLKFRIDAKNSIGITEGTTVLSLANPIPSTVSGITASVVSETTETQTIRVSWTPSNDSDIKCYDVFAGNTSGFTADSSSIIATVIGEFAEFTINKTEPAITAYYYRIQVNDLWGKNLNSMSGEQTINL